MIAILGKGEPPSEALARRALAAVPYPTPDVATRRLGDCLIGVATRPDFADEELSSGGDMIGAIGGILENATELHRELTTAGHPPISSAPADIVVAAFRAFGADAPNRFRGTTSGFVTDGRALWCFRDHVGFRSMFYRDEPRRFVAASESRQVAVGAELREEPDIEVLECIMYGDMPSDLPAALKGVSRLAQATTARAEAGKPVALRTYWHPIELVDTLRISHEDAHDRFLELLAQASARSLGGRDAIFLSGGLDAPAVAAYAAPEHRRRTGRNIGAVSAVFPDLPAVDELSFIEIVVKRYGIDLHTYRPHARVLDDVDTWCRRFATPVPVLSIPEVAHGYTLARELGYDNILTGEFAEFAYGSPKHALQHLLTHGRWGTLASLIRSERRRGVSAQSFAVRLIATFVPGKLANRYFHWRGEDLPQRIPEWLDAARVNARPFRFDLMPPARERWRMLQVGGTHGATVMAEADATCATMAGVRARRPFADIDLWEFFLRLPVEVKFPQLVYKSMAKRALRGVLPDEIVDRKYKTAFDSHVMSQVDYPTLERLLVQPHYQMPGVNYALLASRIAQRDFKLFDWFWAKDLACIHAFLGGW